MPCGMNLEIALEPVRRVLRKDASDTVAAHDVVQLDVRVLPVLPNDGMVAILREQLRAAGWVDQPDGTMTIDLGDAKATLSKDGANVEIRREETRKVQVAREATIRKSDDDAKVESELDKQLRQELERNVAAERERIEKQNLARLTALEPEVREKLQEALNRTYRRALEERARQLGELESLRESGDVKGTYEVTIVVKA